MSYIRQKKIWKKRFTEEELAYIWSCFIHVSPIYKKAWEDKDMSFLHSLSISNGFFIHPETDLHDDTMGIEPKHIKKWISQHGQNGLEETLFILNAKVVIDEKFKRDFTDQDNMILWDSIWKQHVVVDEDVETSLYLTAKNLGFKFKDKSYLFENPWMVYFVNQDIEKTIQKQSHVWKNVHNRVPQELVMVFLNPERFHLKELHIIEELFGSKQIGKLSKSDKFYAANLLGKFGGVMDLLPPSQVKKIRIPENFILEGMSPDEAKKVIQLKQDLALEDISFAKKIFESGFAESVKDHLKTLEQKMTDVVNVKEAFINILLEMSRVKNDKDIEGALEMLLSSDPTHVSEVSTFLKRPISVHDVRTLYHVWSARTKEQSIETISGKVGSYTFEMLDKTKDPTGLYLGYITDCCQVPNMSGFDCLLDGFNNESSSFFVVRKKGKIYAQSWVWVKEVDGEKIICFDSLEVLGKNLNKTPDIMGCYLEASKQLIKLGYDYVTCGADGNTIPEGLSDYAEEHIHTDDELYELLCYEGPSNYTDTEEDGLFILKQRS